LPQNASSGSRTAPQVGQAYSIFVPQRPQNASAVASGAPHSGQPPSAGGGFPAHSRHKMTGVPLRRTGFHAAVRFPQSAQARSRASDASINRNSGREGGDSGGDEVSSAESPSGGSAIRQGTATTA
jgi:hypothetical protein